MNIKKPSRAGVVPKTVFYTQTKTENRFNYQDFQSLKIHNPVLQLKGNLSRRVTPDKSIDRSQQEDYCPHRRVNLKVLPESKRTLVPKLNKEEDQRSKSALNFKKISYVPEDILNSVIKTTEAHMNYNQGLKVVYSKKMLPHVFKTLENRKYNVPKNIQQFNEFSKYTYTTQITTLPGGKKRDLSDIKDNHKSFEVLKESQKKKINSDLKSQIVCLKPSLSGLSKEKSQRNMIRKHLEQNFKITDNNYLSNKSDVNALTSKNYQTKAEKLGIIDAYKPTGTERDLIPHPKIKVKNAKNFYISQIKIK